MERITVSLEDEQYEELVNEADRRGVSKSQVARDVFDRWQRDSPGLHNSSQRGEGVVNSGGEETVNSGEDVVNRLDELEERLAEIEARQAVDDEPRPDDGRERPQQAGERAPSPPAGASPGEDTGGHSSASQAAQSGGEIDATAFVDEYDVPGIDDDTQAQRRAALRAVVDRLEDGPVKSGELREVYDDEPGGYDSDRSWWSNLVHPFLKAARDRGAIGYHADGELRHHYYLPVDDRDEPDVYDPTAEF